MINYHHHYHDQSSLSWSIIIITIMTNQHHHYHDQLASSSIIYHLHHHRDQSSSPPSIINHLHHHYDQSSSSPSSTISNIIIMTQNCASHFPTPSFSPKCSRVPQHSIYLLFTHIKFILILILTLTSFLYRRVRWYYQQYELPPYFVPKFHLQGVTRNGLRWV